jgi:asparagine synthase (glutamine-hydrolysing)
MVATLRHRGPDSTGCYVDGPVALGVARLRIIDLAGGDQPVGGEDGQVQVVLNGEIYNFPALRRELTTRGHRFTTAGDTEVIAHAWEEAGEGALEDFNGMFAFALWDRRRRTLFLARDRMGEKPLYWASAERWLVFGSELRAVLAHPAVEGRLSVEGVARYLAFDYVPDPHTIVHGVSKLSPAHALTAADGKVRVQRYWDVPFDPDAHRRPAAWHEELRARLDAAVRLRLTSDVPLGCFLSGGIDSTAIAATAARQRPGLPTFSVGFAEARHDEREFARLVAGRIGAQHHELEVSAADAAAVLPQLGRLLDEPIADMSFVPLYLLARAARPHVTVALTGDGGDELFAGYPSLAAEGWQERFAALPTALRRALLAGERVERLPGPLREFLGSLRYRRSVRNQILVGGLAPHRYQRLLAAEAQATLARFDPYADIDETMQACPIRDPIARAIYRYCKTYLAGQNLANADRASMATGLELRAPFLDHTFVELTGRIPSKLKLRGLGDLKAFMKAALADRLPREIRKRGKHGFTAPFGQWFRGPLREWVEDLLAPTRLAGELFDVVAVRALVGHHLAGRADHAKLLWALLVLQAWRAETGRR